MSFTSLVRSLITTIPQFFTALRQSCWASWSSGNHSCAVANTVTAIRETGLLFAYTPCMGASITVRAPIRSLGVIRSAHRADLKPLLFPRWSKRLCVLERCELHKVERQLWLSKDLAPTGDERERLVGVDTCVTLNNIRLPLICPIARAQSRTRTSKSVVKSVDN